MGATRFLDATFANLKKRFQYDNFPNQIDLARLGSIKASKYFSKVLSFGFTKKVFINSKTFSEMFLVNTATRFNLAHFIIFYLRLHQKELL